MAASDPVQSIKGNTTCPICLDLFQDPVTSDCGHSFCKDCILHCEGESNITCPQCKTRFQRRNLRANRELRNIVESVPQLLKTKEEPGRGIQCEKHREPLKLYCKEDQVLLCVVCERSQVHRVHTVVPRDEAAQELMETIIELKKQLQSATEKLHLLEDKDWKPLPQRARDEELQRLKRPTEKSPGSQWKSFSPGKKIAVETELQGHKEKKNNRKRVSKKQESKSHVIHASEEASVPNQSYLDSIIHQIRITTEDAEHNKVDVAGLRRRFEVSMSSKESLDPGLRSGKHLASSDHTWIVQVGSKENKKRESAGENVSEKQNGASSHVVEETQTLKRGISETSRDLTPPTLNPSVEEAEDNQVDVAGLRQRFEVSMSSKESLDPGLRSGKHLASSDQTWIVQVGSKKNKKRESAGENVSEKQNGASSHVGEETQTPKHGINRTSQDMTPPTASPTVEEAEGIQVHVVDLRQRFEGLDSESSI